MAQKRKVITIVKLERHPHRDARERLRQAYILLIKANQNAQENTEVKKDEENTSKEVIS
jgi:hypothetical protein